MTPSQRPCHGCLPRWLRHGGSATAALPRHPRASLGLSSGSPRACLRALLGCQLGLAFGPGSQVWRHETLGSGAVFSSCWIFHLCLKPFHHGFRVRSLTLTSDQATRLPRQARHSHGTLGHGSRLPRQARLPSDTAPGTVTGTAPGTLEHGSRRLCHGCLPRLARLPSGSPRARVPTLHLLDAQRHHLTSTLILIF